jgi:predicted NUDIX family NTP pyrophosphohydrolase
VGAGKRSAGLMMFRRRPGGIEVFLVHPGGPFFTRRNDGAWSIPKGELEADEDPLDVARREFGEETGRSVTDCAREGAMMSLGTITQRGGKTVEAWGFEGEWPEGTPIESNTFTMEWPPHSGRTQAFPEVDRGSFFSIEEAKRKINPAQAELIDRLIAALSSSC